MADKTITNPEPVKPTDETPSRRRLIKGLGLGAAAATLAACGDKGSAADCGDPSAPAVQRKRAKRLTMVTTWPKGLPGLGTAAEYIGRRIGELTEGELEVKVYAAGEFSPALQAFDDVATGAADMYHGAEYYWQNKSPAFPFYCAVPFGMTAAEMMGWIDFGGGQALWEELSGQFGVISFQCTNTSCQTGGWFRREINSLDDFQGLKMRIPGLGGEVIRGLGGASEVIPGGEIYQALQSGTIDATEWVGPWNDLALGFYQEAPYYYGPGFQEPGAALALGINRKVWDEFTPIQQEIIKSVCSETNHRSIGEFTYQNARALKTLTEEHGVQLRTYPDDVLAKAREISADVRAQAASAGDLEKRIYESFENAMKSMEVAGAFSEGAYYAARKAGL
ncbi:MAG: ABC transporter substrate-binding protein [Hirschia sp.]|nr:ABC transporter substrate-binding protein [Hirschia sp.]MBF17113.1 ABC transporter substrate-binding protein [Hirschia sp.]